MPSSHSLMSDPKNTASATRRTIGALLVLTIIGIFLSLYFLKYVPSQRNDFHNRAFLELSQIANAYRLHEEAIDTTYSIHHARQERHTAAGKDLKMAIQNAGSADNDRLRADAASILPGVIANYRNIFTDYLLIRQNYNSTDSIGSNHKNATGKMTRIYYGGALALYTHFNPDTLLSTPDGFSLNAIRDVKIGGNSYKLILYPFDWEGDSYILGGLLPLSDYTQGYETIPVNMITQAAILLLLLILALPLIRIFVLGFAERIDNMNIRMIIGVYFVGPFLLFFLFANDLVQRVQTANTETHLENLSIRIEKGFYTEINDICKELNRFDYKFMDLCRQADPESQDQLAKQLRSLRYEKIDPEDPAILELNERLHPSRYLQLDNVFWIDTAGNVAARWGFKKAYSEAPPVILRDRQYYKDIMQDRLLVLPAPYNADSFTIQPTLSKLDAGYTVNVAIKSRYQYRWLPFSQDTLIHATVPVMLGLSARMYSVVNPVFPNGYHFSIVDAEGNILFDSKPGLGSLANLYDETPDKTAILQAIKYRYRSMQKSLMFRGRQVSMLVRPVSGTSLSIVVDYDLSDIVALQVHTFSLLYICMGGVLLLIILSGLCNEWAKSKASLLNIPGSDFEWLRPSIDKSAYYRHLIRWMTFLSAGYILGWILSEWWCGQDEFCMFILSLLFPFYVSGHYYLLRDSQRSTPAGEPVASRSPATLLLLIVAGVINAYALYTIHNPRIGIVILIQLIWGIIIYSSIQRFSNAPSPADMRKTLRSWSFAILTGIILISIVPAAGLFALLYREESCAGFKLEKLDMAHALTDRRDSINTIIPAYRFDPRDPGDWRYLYKLKFQHGVYFPDGSAAETGDPAPLSPTPASLYTPLHQLFLSSESPMLWQAGSPQMAEDSSWYFYTPSGGSANTEQLIYRNRQDNIHTAELKLPVSGSTGWSALRWIRESYRLTGLANGLWTLCIFALIAYLIILLTHSLAKRIFILGLFENYTPSPESGNSMDTAMLVVSPGPALEHRMQSEGYTNFSAQDIFQWEKSIPPPPLSENMELRVLFVQHELERVYELVWNQLPDQEKYILFDLAQDGFANYKTAFLLHRLMEKGILLEGEGQQLEFMSKSFRNYVLQQVNSKAIASFLKKSRKDGSWASFKFFFFLGLAALGLFIFFTQDAIYQKITGLLASISSLLPILTHLFDKGNGNGKNTQSS
jgi:hypothetical protein